MNNAKELSFLFHSREAQIKKWKQQFREAGDYIMEDDGSLAGYAAPILDKTGVRRHCTYLDVMGRAQ